MEREDLSLLHTWLNLPHVHEFYDKDRQNSKEDVQKRYAPKIRGEKPTDCYFVLYNNKPVAYIQKYRVNDYEELGPFLDYDDSVVSVDLFIGDKEYMGKGFGNMMLSKFISDILFTNSDIRRVMIGPEPSNCRAIKSYQKAGFKHVQTLKIGDEYEDTYVMEFDLI